MWSIVENLMTGSKQKQKLQFYPGDAEKFLKWGSIGFLGFGMYQMAATLAKRNVNPCVEFKDPVEAIHFDPMIRDAYIRLQNYREINPWLFKSSLQNTDQLLFLENALLTEQVYPSRQDKDLSFTYFRMAVNRLNQFQHLIRSEMGNEHAMAVNMIVKKVYEQLQKHFLNILHLCSEFKPEHLIQRAPLEVAAALKRMEAGIPPKNNSAKVWERLRGKLRRELGEEEEDHISRTSSSSKKSRSKSHAKSEQG